MKSEWNYVKLGEVVNFETGKLDSNQAEDEGIYPFFTCSPITLSINKIAFDTEAVLLAGNNANGIFPVKYYKGKFNAYQRTYIVTPKDRSYISTKWLYFRIKQLTKELRDLSVGSATKFLTKKILDNFEIKLPNIIIQNKTVNILWPLEDKIELNRKMNETLEAMAQAIFKSWFIDFDPVHAKARSKTKADLETEAKKLGITPEILELFPSEFEESELGMIPKGWEVKKFGDIVIPKKGKNITKKTIMPGKIPVVAGGLTPAYYHSQSNVKSPVITISASGANAGYVNLYTEDIWASDCSYINETNSDYIFSHYIFLKLKQYQITRMQQGAAQPHIYPSHLMRLDIIDCGEKLWNYYENTIRPMFNKIAENRLEIQTLQKNRDTLLPKLLSGELDLSEVEI